MKYLLFLFLLTACSPTNVDIVRVIDGDTFEFNGQIIRLLNVDTPEKGQVGYEEAKIELQKLLYQKEIILIGNKTDKYNRSIRIVIANGINVNKEIYLNFQK